jgi:hypothetical protein
MAPADIAYDCIADLFRRGESGALVHFTSYFEGIPIRQSSDDELLIHLRRLVFSAVNQSIFRLYNEIDPSLGKILRNIRISIQTLQNFAEIERFGENHIVPGLCDPLEQLLVPDRETLESALLPLTTGRENIPELLSRLSLYLRRQSCHSRIVSLVEVALAFRSVYTAKRDREEQTEQSDEELQKSDMRATIRWACGQVREQMRPAYVGKGKVTHEQFSQYIEAIGVYLIGKAGADGTGDLSLYECCLRATPSMGREEFRTVHRSRLEYLTRAVQKKIVSRIGPSRG